MLALAACGGETTAPAPESEPREPAERPAGTGLRAAALNARCKKLVRGTAPSFRVAPRRAREPFPAYGRRVRRAVAQISRVYWMLHRRLKDLPGAQEDEPFRSYLSVLGATADQFEIASGYAPRNRIELESGLHYPDKTYRHLATFARALDAPRCAPRLTLTSERRSP